MFMKSRVTVTDANTGGTTVSFQYVVIYDAAADSSLVAAGSIHRRARM